ncbi:MAG: ATP-grasp domain-containing protein [Gemmatimonadetes bacterium]|nr:ATP-grasp domain-containing protein [Gemmatimonadota bacterium]
MRIAVAYDRAADQGGTADTAGVLPAVHGVLDALARAGHAAFPIAACTPLERFMGRLTNVDLVFNLVETLDGRAEDEPRVAALLELTGRRVTGARSDTLALCRRKDRVNALLQAAGIPVPAWTIARKWMAEVPEWDDFPAIVKPAGEDGSRGISEQSVVDDAVELRAAIARCEGDALVQRFVPGRELNVGIVGSVLLPVAEIEFSGAQRLVTYAAKWEPGSDADLGTTPVCPARIPPAMAEEAHDLAERAWHAVGGSGYARVDLRADDLGRLHVLEVNPNPDLSPGAGLARMAATAGWTYDGLVARIVREAGR